MHKRKLAVEAMDDTTAPTLEREAATLRSASAALADIMAAYPPLSPVVVGCTQLCMRITKELHHIAVR